MSERQRIKDRDCYFQLVISRKMREEIKFITEQLEFMSMSAFMRQAIEHYINIHRQHFAKYDLEHGTFIPEGVQHAASQELREP